jgi:Fe-S-cluster containining protein
MRDVLLHLTKTFSDQISKASTPGDIGRVFKSAWGEFDKLKNSAQSLPNNDVACVKGCSFCCYLPVTVSSHEAIMVVQHVQKYLSEDHVLAIIRQSELNMQQMLSLSHEECERTNIKCPLLSDDGRCLCYDVRPIACRRYNSRNAGVCETFHKDPQSTVCQDSASDIDMVGALVMGALKTAFDQNGYDSGVYYLNHTLHEGLTNPKAVKRWRSRKAAFSKRALTKESSD